MLRPQEDQESRITGLVLPILYARIRGGLIRARGLGTKAAPERDKLLDSFLH